MQECKKLSSDLDGGDVFDVVGDEADEE